MLAKTRTFAVAYQNLRKSAHKTAGTTPDNDIGFHYEENA